MRPWAILALLLTLLTVSGVKYRSSLNLAFHRPAINLPLEYFWGIAHVESDFDPMAIGYKDGLDLGMWQFRVMYNRERGLVNPFDPVESTQKAIVLFQKNFAYLKTIDKAISAHKRGRGWVQKHGIDKEYIKLVKGK
jgi:hypothetical protein